MTLKIPTEIHFILTNIYKIVLLQGLSQEFFRQISITRNQFMMFSLIIQTFHRKQSTKTSYGDYGRISSNGLRQFHHEFHWNSFGEPHSFFFFFQIDFINDYSKDCFSRIYKIAHETHPEIIQNYSSRDAVWILATYHPEISLRNSTENLPRISEEILTEISSRTLPWNLSKTSSGSFPRFFAWIPASDSTSFLEVMLWAIVRNVVAMFSSKIHPMVSSIFFPSIQSGIFPCVSPRLFMRSSLGNLSRPLQRIPQKLLWIFFRMISTVLYQRFI